MKPSVRNFLLTLPASTRLVSAHMMMSEPAPLKAKDNPYTKDIDYSYTNPLSPSGADYPCKGHLSALGTEEATPVGTWSAGETHDVIISGHTTHSGGSCQVGLSVDSGVNFKTLHTYQGQCPLSDGHKLTFKVPADTPSTDEGILAWTWFNNVGNREMYMNCAVIKIENGGDGSDFDGRPNLFRANTNGCKTVDSMDVMIPNPGPDVTVNNAAAVPPVGDCEIGPGAGSGNSDQGSGSDSGSGDHTGDGHDGDAEYKPGNNWPDWFRSSGLPSVFGSEQVLWLLGMLILSICLHYTWFSDLV